MKLRKLAFIFLAGMVGSIGAALPRVPIEIVDPELNGILNHDSINVTAIVEERIPGTQLEECIADITDAKTQQTSHCMDFSGFAITPRTSTVRFECGCRPGNGRWRIEVKCSYKNGSELSDLVEAQFCKK